MSAIPFELLVPVWPGRAGIDEPSGYLPSMVADGVHASWFADFTTNVYDYDSNLIYDYIFPSADALKPGWFADFTRNQAWYDPEAVLPRADGAVPTIYADMVQNTWRVP